MEKGSKVLITGGLGFIFSHVTEWFLDQGMEVYVIDNLSAGSHAELLPDLKARGLHFLNEDVAFSSVVPLISGIDPEYIIHAAAISDVDYSIKNPTRTIHTNNHATQNVFDAARNCKSLKKLLYVSTDEVYGECDYPKSEDDIIFPRNPYALSKAFGSILRLAYDNTYPELKDKTLETRFCNVFGPRQDTRKIIPAIKSALTSKKPVVVHNGGKGYRQFIHVAEIPPLIQLLLERGTRTYNITSGQGFTVEDLVHMAEDYTGLKIPTIAGKRSGMDLKYQMSSLRLFDEFGWLPSRTFEERFSDYLESE